MYINSEGIIFRQTKISGGRRMVLLFTKKYGKISAGSNINEKGKTKSALAMRPFTYGNYEVYKNKGYYNVNSADVVKSFYKIGEDVDKYMLASFVLELTEKMVPEELPSPKLFNLLMDFLGEFEKRQKKYETLVLAYEVKALDILGTFPELSQCARCGQGENLTHFSVKDGGIICEDCARESENQDNDSLIYDAKFGIVDILKYFAGNRLETFEKIALETEVADKLQSIIKSYFSYYLDIGNLKSESIFEGKL